jgi:hypothetical protein
LGLSPKNLILFRENIFHINILYNPYLGNVRRYNNKHIFNPHDLGVFEFVYKLSQESISFKESITGTKEELGIYDQEKMETPRKSMWKICVNNSR